MKKKKKEIIIKSIAEFEEIYLPQTKKEKEIKASESKEKIGLIWAKETMKIVRNILRQQ
ncbi:hypothetical protein J7K43_02940 [Candidatus Calescamantes bacterium]|nr:hypothetical protein [Candidatus Calescamantes bacterium]